MIVFIRNTLASVKLLLQKLKTFIVSFRKVQNSNRNSNVNIKILKAQVSEYEERIKALEAAILTGSQTTLGITKSMKEMAAVQNSIAQQVSFLSEAMNIVMQNFSIEASNDSLRFFNDDELLN